MGDLGSEFKNTSEVSLEDIFENEKYTNGKAEVVYEYDFGDSWEHDIVFLGREAPGVRNIMSNPSFMPVVYLNGEVSGFRLWCGVNIVADLAQEHPCAEDVGGVPGWEDLKDLFAHPRQRDVDDTRGWYKNGGCLNGDPKGLDPYRWNILQVNFELENLVKEGIAA